MHFEQSDRNRVQLWLWVALALLALCCMGLNHAEATPADAVESAKQSASDAATAIKSEASPPTFADKLKESFNKAGQQLQGYADQLAAQIPKRLKRQSQFDRNHDGLNHQNHHHQDINNHQHHHSDESSHHSTSGNDSPTRLSQVEDKLDSARQLVQKIRERCLRSLEQNQNSRDRPRLRRQTQERSSSSDTLGKLGELGDKVRNKTTDARQLIQNIRTKCAEILSNNHNNHRDNQHDHHNDHHNDHYNDHSNNQHNHQQHGSSHNDRDNYNRDHDNFNQRDRAPKRLRRQAASPSAPPAGFLSGQSPADALVKFGEQVRDQAAAAAQRLQTMGDQLVASVQQAQAPKRTKRQVQYPKEQQPAEASAAAGNGVLKYISDLGQQAQQAQAISQFLQAAGASGSQGPVAGAQPNGGSGGGASGAQLAQVLGQLTDLIKSTQNRNERLVESSQRSLEATGQQTMETAKSAQSGFQAAIGEMTQGLQKLAANNPNLVPDIKKLYQSVSSKLSGSATGSPQTAVAPGQVSAQSA